MAIDFSAFERDVAAFAPSLDPDEMSRELAAFAREEVAKVIAEGIASPTYVRSVDGIRGAVEESVKGDGTGVILYEFSYLDEIAVWALNFCQASSPVLSGSYKESWFVTVNGAQWSLDQQVPPGAEVMVTNDQPYHRKVETGHMKMSVPPGIVERCAQQINNRFGNVVLAQVRFISLQGEYVLKGKGTRRRANGRRRQGKDQRAGRTLTYPAVVINMRG